MKTKEKDNRKIVFVVLLLTALFVFHFSGAKDNSLSYFQDRDQDGLSDEEEKALGTDWQKADTDGDGYTDGVEVKSGYNPLVPAPGDKLLGDDKKKIDTFIKTNKNKKNLTQEFIAKLQAKKGQELEIFKSVNENGVVASLEGAKKLQNISLTNEDIKELTKETLKSVDINDELKVIAEDELKILPKIVAKNNRKKKIETKKQVENYLTETGYIMISNLPFEVKDGNSFNDKISNFLTGIGEDIVLGDDLKVRKSKSNLRAMVEALKQVETPYVLKNIHQETVSLLQYLLEQDETVVFKKDDPIAMGLMVGKMQAILNKLQEIQSDLDDILIKYEIGKYALDEKMTNQDKNQNKNKTENKENK